MARRPGPTLLALYALCGVCWSSVAVASYVHRPHDVTRFCEFYNETMCAESRGQGGQQGCNEQEECPRSERDDPEKRNHCFVLWHTDGAGRMTIRLKGCFLNSIDCYNKTECVDKAHAPKKDLMFCCCEGDMCNQNFTWEPAPTRASAGADGQPAAARPAGADGEASGPGGAAAYAVAALLAAAALVAAGYWACGRRKPGLFDELPTAEPAATRGSPVGGARPIQLLEVKARGRFGAVWRARLASEDVAVKIFPVQDKQSWLAEQHIYRLPHMQHPNVLRYLGVERRGDGLQAEFWLVTAYHERGSLCDFLKAHTLSPAQLCRVAESMARGLTHLHEEVAGGARGFKPAVAHRDFKSKNVLLRADLTACVADFGLALVFEPGKPCGDTHGQVGTRRYMAPEVLEGAISFTQDAFLRIDMYACGLVLWELASRCDVSAGAAPPPDYRLPFEDEVGQHPTLEDMQESVVQRKVRPAVPAAWRQQPALHVLCDTMEECWDHDAEARLSASCVLERLSVHARHHHQQQQQQLLLRQPPPAAANHNNNNNNNAVV